MIEDKYVSKKADNRYMHNEIIRTNTYMVKLFLVPAGVRDLGSGVIAPDLLAERAQSSRPEWCLVGVSKAKVCCSVSPLMLND